MKNAPKFESTETRADAWDLGSSPDGFSVEGTPENLLRLTRPGKSARPSRDAEGFEVPAASPAPAPAASPAPSKQDEAREEFLSTPPVPAPIGHTKAEALRAAQPFSLIAPVTFATSIIGKLKSGDVPRLAAEVEQGLAELKQTEREWAPFLNPARLANDAANEVSRASTVEEMREAQHRLASLQNPLNVQRAKITAQRKIAQAEFALAEPTKSLLVALRSNANALAADARNEEKAVALKWGIAWSPGPLSHAVGAISKRLAEIESREQEAHRTSAQTAAHGGSATAKSLKALLAGY